VRLEQVLSNVLGNAVRYTPRGGHVTLTASRGPGRQAQIVVQDDGCGIAPELLPRIFEPFVQADTSLHRSEGGLGLGLALVKGIIDLHRGTVALRSGGTDKGCRVELRLPLIDGPTAAFATSPPVSGRAGQRSLRVLFVDDNADLTEMLSILVEARGHQTRTAADGYAAIEVVKSFAPHVAFIDIGLPELDGFQVARELRALRTEAVLIAMSGYGHQEDRRQSLDAGFDLHLVKPVPLEKIEEVLSGVAASSGALDCLGRPS